MNFGIICSPALHDISVLLNTSQNSLKDALRIFKHLQNSIDSDINWGKETLGYWTAVLTATHEFKQLIQHWYLTVHQGELENVFVLAAVETCICVISNNLNWLKNKTGKKKECKTENRKGRKQNKHC